MKYTVEVLGTFQYRTLLDVLTPFRLSVIGREELEKGLRLVLHTNKEIPDMEDKFISECMRSMRGVEVRIKKGLLTQGPSST